MSDLTVATILVPGTIIPAAGKQFVCSMWMQSAREQTNQENEEEEGKKRSKNTPTVDTDTVFLLTLFISKEITTDSNT